LTEFKSLGLSDTLLKAIEEIGYDTPTPIQRNAIPLILKGNDLLGLAQTGTGKTAAFGLPLAHRLLEEGRTPEPKAARALILAPTRELVNQIASNLTSFIRKTPLRLTSVVGGVSINPQIKRLGRGTDILVATPGRLLDLVDRKAVHLNKASYLVLDEADQMLDLGFIHALRRIAGLVAEKRHTLLFSATMPRQIEDLARTYLHKPERVEVAPAGKTAEKVAQSVHFMDQKAKSGFLVDMICERADDTCLVFCRTKHGAERLMKRLVAAGVSAGSIHGNKSQNQRDRAIKGLREGSLKVLVATDVAARGIDIPSVSHVYNFELPEVAEAYVHRIGRTARAGASGDAISLCSAEEVALLRQIEKLTGIEIEVASGEAPAPVKLVRKGRNQRSGQRPAQHKARGNGGQRSGEKSGPKASANENRKNRPKRRPRRENRAA